MVIKDIFGVIYAPHKTFKKIAQNPKYLAVAIIILLFVALQSASYYSYYSKVNYEQTMPPADQLNAFVSSNATNWVTTSGLVVQKVTDDYINQTYYGNNSLEFSLYSNSFSIALEQFGYTADCGSDGFTSLCMSIKQLSSGTPQSSILTLYTANDTSNYFTLDITSMLTNNIGQWNNLTIPVGTSDWQSTVTPVWSEITGLQLSITYPTTNSNNSILLQGIFFRGQYLTLINASSVGAFIGFAAYSTVMQIAFQWLILAAIAYMILKSLKMPNVVWRNIFAVMGFTFMIFVIISAIGLLNSFTLQTVHYPYDFPPHGALVYPDFIVNGASPVSQIVYESIITTTATYTTINTALNILMYALLVIPVTFAVKAISGIPYVTTSHSDTETPQETVKVPISEFSYVKSLAVAILTVILLFACTILLIWIGIF